MIRARKMTTANKTYSMNVHDEKCAGLLQWNTTHVDVLKSDGGMASVEGISIDRCTETPADLPLMFA